MHLRMCVSTEYHFPLHRCTSPKSSIEFLRYQAYNGDTIEGGTPCHYALIEWECGFKSSSCVQYVACRGYPPPTPQQTNKLKTTAGSLSRASESTHLCNKGVCLSLFSFIILVTNWSQNFYRFVIICGHMLECTKWENWSMTFCQRCPVAYKSKTIY